jgi:CheY-like chemotaxis protein
MRSSWTASGICCARSGPTWSEKIFEEFYQLGNQERDREHGLGLGLAIVRGLARLLGHPIAVRSVPERSAGSEFVIELPAGDPARASVEEAGQASSRPGTHTLAGRRILVIDDEREIRDALAALLASWGCLPASASSLQEVLATYGATGSERPEIVLCDYRLRGGTTGAEVLKELEARWGCRLPSVIITGDTSPERIQEARRAGRPVLFKPVVPGKLRALLSALQSSAGSTGGEAIATASSTSSP